MKRIFLWLASLSVIVIGVIAFLGERDIPPQLPVQRAAEPPPPVQQAPAIAYPLPEVVPNDKPLPELDRSDDAFRDALVHVQRRLGELLLPERLVRNIVVTIDNLPREELAARVRPFKQVPGAFGVARDGQQLRIAGANEKRYQDYVRVLEATDPDRVVETYIRFYPLFQKAYQELGYPQRYFNDRLVAVLDHLLAAPDPGPDVELVQPRVFYEFADPELQRASAGHKVMMRMGADNARRVKAHLEKIRARVVAASEQVRSPS